MRTIRREIRGLGALEEDELYVAAKELQAPYDLVAEVARRGKLPVVPVRRRRHRHPAQPAWHRLGGLTDTVSRSCNRSTRAHAPHRGSEADALSPPVEHWLTRCTYGLACSQEECSRNSPTRSPTRPPTGLTPVGLTYSGHPLACASAVASIDVLRNERVVEHSRALGADVIGPRLRGIAANHPSVDEVRGVGTFLGDRVDP